MLCRLLKPTLRVIQQYILQFSFIYEYPLFYFLASFLLYFLLPTIKAMD